MNKVKAFGSRVLAEMVESPDLYRKTKGGIYTSDKDGTADAIRPRWFKVYSVGEEVEDVSVGEYVLMEHGRWTPSMKVDDATSLHMLDNKDMLATTNKDPMEGLV